MQEEALRLLRCPKCGGALTRRDRSLVCPQAHCYDIARQGHVNLAPGARESFYTKALFESRACVFEAGIYEPVVQAMTRVLGAHLPQAGGALLDAGCGEGYYLLRVCPERTPVRMGFDLCKEAVRLAAGREKRASFFVADLANIPVAQGSFDAVLDVFTPANYAQFRRVLRPGGVVVKLAPRRDYLIQLRRAAAGLLRHEEYDGAQVERYAGEHMKLLDTQAITYTLPVDGELAFHLARMTPMLAGIDVSRLDLSGVTQITIDETMIIGTFE